MRRPTAWLLMMVLPVAASGASFEFGATIAVTGASREAVYHQLDGPARQHVAVSGRSVGVVWEDNRDGSAQAYVAIRRIEEEAFREAARVSTGRAASEPVIASLGKGRFLIAWEQDGAVWVRRAEGLTLGPSVKVAAKAAHIVLAARNGSAYAAWSEQQGQFLRLRSAPLFLGDDDSLRLGAAVTVERGTPEGDQTYPSLALLAQGGVVAWEDRRRGHTAIYYAAFDQQLNFRPPQVLNEFRAQRRFNYGRGPGAARVALAACGGSCVAATWLDKRDFLSGYDIYAAQSNDAGRTFGKNEKVQDEFGSNISQWHGAIAAGKGQILIAWDDDRDETADVWLSWREAGGWSADLAVPGASGPAQQSSPALALDDDGNLHLAWLHRDTEAGPTQIRYLMGRASAGVNPP